MSKLQCEVAQSFETSSLTRSVSCFVLLYWNVYDDMYVYRMHRKVYSISRPSMMMEDGRRFFAQAWQSPHTLGEQLAVARLTTHPGINGKFLDHCSILNSGTMFTISFAKMNVLFSNRSSPGPCVPGDWFLTCKDSAMLNALAFFCNWERSEKAAQQKAPAQGTCLEPPDRSRANEWTEQSGTHKVKAKLKANKDMKKLLVACACNTKT